MSAPDSATIQRVAVLDDDADLAAAVTRLLARQGFSVRTFVDPAALLAALEEDRFACIVSDVQMGATNGFAFAEEVRRCSPCTAVVFMTAWPNTAHAVDAVLHHGGLDYLEKPVDTVRLGSAVRRALEWSARRQTIEAATAAFTRRESEVFGLLVRGHSNKEIAEHLAISARTVENHRAAIMHKTRANGLAQLIALANADG